MAGALPARRATARKQSRALGGGATRSSSPRPIVLAAGMFVDAPAASGVVQGRHSLRVAARPHDWLQDSGGTPRHRLPDALVPFQPRVHESRGLSAGTTAHGSSSRAIRFAPLRDLGQRDPGSLIAPERRERRSSRTRSRIFRPAVPERLALLAEPLRAMSSTTVTSPPPRAVGERARPYRVLRTILHHRCETGAARSMRDACRLTAVCKRGSSAHDAVEFHRPPLSPTCRRIQRRPQRDELPPSRNRPGSKCSPRPFTE
jgi:hypothetical protein